jgi:hypothetical protein
MNTFTIDTDNCVSVHSPDAAIPGDAVRFASGAEFAEVVRDWSMNRLIEVWNKLSKVTPVTKFTDRKTAIRRIWTAIEKTEPRADQKPAAKPRAAAKKKPPAKVRAAAKAKPGSRAKPSAGRTKTDQVIAALREPNGATALLLSGNFPQTVLIDEYPAIRRLGEDCRHLRAKGPTEQPRAKSFTQQWLTNEFHTAAEGKALIYWRCTIRLRLPGV